MSCRRRLLLWFWVISLWSDIQSNFESSHIVRGRKRVSWFGRSNHDSRFFWFWPDNISRDTACIWFTSARGLHSAKTKDFKVEFIPWYVILYVRRIERSTVVPYYVTVSHGSDFDRSNGYWVRCLSIVPRVSVVSVACTAGRNYNRGTIMNYARDQTTLIPRLFSFHVLSFRVDAWTAFIHFSWRPVWKRECLVYRKPYVKRAWYSTQVRRDIL